MTKINSSARRWRFATALMLGSAAAAFVVAVPAEAQQAGASLRGVITDNGQPAGTEVTAVNVDTGFRSVSRINNGSYNFPSLLPGRYRLDVTTAGGTRQTDVFTLTVAEAAQLSFDLSTTAANAAAAGANTQPNPNAPAETASAAPSGGGNDIIVTGNRIQQLDAGEVGVTVSQHQIEALPQDNRNFLAFANIAPGVQLISQSGGNQKLQGGVQPTNAINVFIDGVSQKDDILTGGITGQDSSPGNPFPQLGIAQYKVISQNYKAEYDEVSSAAITAVTKSGTNQFHGEAFFDFSNQSLRAKTPQEKHQVNADGSIGISKVKTQDEQFGAALGGPIIKDVLHFFVTYEGKRLLTPVTVTPPSGVSLASIPDQYRSDFGEFNKNFDENLYFGKLDFEPDTSDLFELSGTVRRESSVEANNGPIALSTGQNVRNNETRILFHYQHTASSWVNDLRVEHQDVDWNPTPIDNDVQDQFFTGAAQGDAGERVLILQYGGGTNYQNKGQKGWTAQDDFTFTGLAGNTFKVGAKGQWLTLHTVQQTPYNPIYYYDADYPTQGGWNDSIPYQLQFGVPVAGGGGGAVKSNDFQLGLYAQDDWDITDRFTANIGIRWDYERDPAYLNYQTPTDVVTALRDWTNLDNANFNVNDYISNGHNRHAHTGEFQPRLGFTYDLTKDGRFQLFGGYGRSYNRDQFDYLSLERLQGSYKTVTFNFNTGDPEHPCAAGSNCIPFDPAYLTQAGRDSLATSTNDAGREIDLLNNNLKVPFSDQFSIGVRGRFGQIHAEVGYTHVVSQDGFLFLLGNRQPDGSFFVPGGNSTSSAQPPYGFPVPGYGSLILGTNGLTTKLDQPYVTLSKDYTKASPWSFHVTYTLSLALENREFGQQYALDYPSSYEYPFLRSTGAPKHRVVATGSTDLPFGFMLSGMFLLESPPYIYGTALADEPDPQDYPATPMTIQGKGPWIKQLDLSLTKYVGLGFLHKGTQVRLRADVFNVFNTANYVGYISNANDPSTFGNPDPNNYDTGGYPPRTVKFTVGLSF